MNPLTRLRNYFIGEALARTDNVFEQARLRLTYNLSVFLFIMSLIFGLTLMANPLPWQIVSFVISTTALVLLFVLLKNTGDAQKAGYAFLFVQLYLSIANSIVAKFQVSFDGTAWMCMGLIFTFFVLGRRWGILLFLINIAMLSVIYVDRILDHTLLDYYIPPEMIPPQEQISLVIPLLIIIYSLWQITETRKEAEQVMQSQTRQLELNNQTLEMQKRDVTASISYAKRIQYAVLPQEETIYRSVPLSFIIYKPKDIVSGDFFWFHEIDPDNYILVCADCTGHGVPGAMMTVIGSSLLNQTVIDNKITQPSQILLVLDNLINVTLKQQKEHEHFVQDGMDLALIKVDKAKKEFTFTSSKRPAVFIRNREITEIKGSKYTLGGMITGCKVFNEVKMNYQEDDIIYFFTDGVTDQFGGEKGKKYSMKRLRELLQNIHRLKMGEQKQKLEQTIESWKGNLEQVDDILLIGIRF